jgi:hypothetical protein
MSTPACSFDVARFWSLSFTLRHKSNTRAALAGRSREPQSVTFSYSKTARGSARRPRHLAPTSAQRNRDHRVETRSELQVEK